MGEGILDNMFHTTTQYSPTLFQIQSIALLLPFKMPKYF